MKSQPVYHVFISYTGQDLKEYAEVVGDIVTILNNSDSGRNWVAIDHKAWAPTGRPSVQECMEQIARCQILIVLVAFRYGWIPSIEEGGDGKSSITQLEVKKAREIGLQVIPFLAEEEAPRWRSVDFEGLTNPSAQECLDRFKAELRQSLAGFFDSPKSLETSTLLALQRAADRIEHSGSRHSATIQTGRHAKSNLIVPSYYDPSVAPTLKERLSTRLPKRILSITSAGPRTSITFGYLERLEQLLRIRYGDETFRICDYFDLIGASGEAATIASDLALGCTVVEARVRYRMCARCASSSKQRWLAGVWKPQFHNQVLQEWLEENYAGLTLNSDKFKTGVCLVLSRVDKQLICTLTNYPDVSDDLRNVSLAQILLSSWATPTYFPPVIISSNGDIGRYFSGDIAVGTDPALHLFLVATGANFPFGWRKGGRRVFLLSIGAGDTPREGPPPQQRQAAAVDGLQALSFALNKQNERNETLLDALAHEGTENTEEQNPDLYENVPSALTYRKFNVNITARGLEEIGLPKLTEEIDSYMSFTDYDRLDYLFEIGTRAAERSLDSNLLTESFDVRPPSVTASK